MYLFKKLYFVMDYRVLLANSFLIIALILLVKSSVNRIVDLFTLENAKSLKSLMDQFTLFMQSYPQLFTSIFMYFFMGLITALFITYTVIELVKSFVWVHQDNEFQYHPHIKWLL